MSALEQDSYLSYIEQVIKEILKTTEPSFISRCNNFIFLNTSYIILHNRHFRNLKTNQLLSKKNYITHTFYYTWRNWCLIHSANSYLSFLWILSYRMDWDFTFSVLHIWLRGKFIHVAEVGYTNIQSKIKINALLI